MALSSTEVTTWQPRERLLFRYNLEAKVSEIVIVEYNRDRSDEMFEHPERVLGILRGLLNGVDSYNGEEIPGGRVIAIFDDQSSYGADRRLTRMWNTFKQRAQNPRWQRRGIWRS